MPQRSLPSQKTFKALPGFETALFNVTKTEYQYKYNWKEWQDELGLNMYAMDMRQYDPAIARWVVMDPVVHFGYSLYNAFDKNPIFWADPTGADSERTVNDLIVGVCNASDLNGGTYSWQNTSNNDSNPDGAQSGYFIKDNTYFEVSGKINYGSYVDIGFENGIEVELGEKSTMEEFSYIKDAGENEATYGLESHRIRDKVNLTIGGAYRGGIKYSNTNGQHSVSGGAFGFGYTYTWGVGQQSHHFIGLDTGVSAGIGMGGAINLKYGLKW